LSINTTFSTTVFDTRWTTFRRNSYVQAPQKWRQWLCNRGSLTEHLINASGGDFHVVVHRQQWLLPHRSEAKALGLKPRQIALIREVKLIGRGQTYVFARTVVPLSTLTGKQKQLSRLGTRALGSLLFSDPSLRRGKFQTSLLTAENKQKAWARRSVFYLSNKPLLVCEMFLPILENIAYTPPMLPNRSISGN